MEFLIDDRVSAGRDLARMLLRYRKRPDVSVLALPRGGVPVGAEVAHALHAPLDLLLVRKLGTPGHEELAMGAIASGGVRVLNRDVIGPLGIDAAAIEAATVRETRELERRMSAYRGSRPWEPLGRRCVIVVDDGVATGATMRAGIAALRAQEPAKIVVAVPVAPVDTIALLRSEADEVVCLATPEPFGSIGQWYARFPQLDDDEVRRILSECWSADERGAWHGAAGSARSA